MSTFWRRLATGAVFSAYFSMMMVGLPLLRGEAVGEVVRWLIPPVGVVVGILAWPLWRAAAERAAETPTRSRSRSLKIAGYVGGGVALAMAISAVIEGGLDAGNLVTGAVIFATIILFAALTPRIAAGRS